MVKENIQTQVKGGEEPMEIVEVISKGYVEVCPICKNKLEPAKSESQAKWNLEIHIKAKHPEEYKNGKQ